MNDDADITLWLHDVRDLFVEPDFDPFDEHAIERPGLEVIANFVEARSLVRRVQVSLFVPRDQSGDDMRARVESAIDRYVARRVEWGENTIRSSRNDGLRGLVYAIVVVVVGLILYAAVLQTGNQIASALAEALFIIVSWVAVWDAAESLILNVLDERRMIRVWQKIAELELTIRPHPLTAAPPGDRLT
jgi:hypothetical protein